MHAHSINLCIAAVVELWTVHSINTPFERPDRTPPIVDFSLAAEVPIQSFLIFLNCLQLLDRTTSTIDFPATEAPTADLAPYTFSIATNHG